MNNRTIDKRISDIENVVTNTPQTSPEDDAVLISESAVHTYISTLNDQTDAVSKM